MENFLSYSGEKNGIQHNFIFNMSKKKLHSQLSHF